MKIKKLKEKIKIKNKTTFPILIKYKNFIATIFDTLSLGIDWLSLEKPKFPVKTTSSNRHLAIMAWALPPNSNAGVYRPLSFIRYGTLLGWQIDAFQGETPANQIQHGTELQAKIPPEAQIHVVPHESRTPSHSFFPRVDGGFKNSIAFALQAIQDLKNNPPSAVFASGPPFFVFVAAYFTARHFKVPLFLDYRDEWSECPFSFVDKSGHDKWWERRCLSKASGVFFTTESHRSHQLSIFKELSYDKTHVVPNGWDPEDFLETKFKFSKNIKNKFITIAHIGALGSHNPADDFLNTVGELLKNDISLRRNMKLQFVGRRDQAANDAIRAFPFQDILEVIDHVGKREANEKMQSADILLLIATSDLERYLPGKLFDYVAAEQPVLIFGATGEASILLEKLNIGICCQPRRTDDLRKAIEKLTNIKSSFDTEKINLWLDIHRRQLLAESLFSKIESGIKQK